MCARSRAFLGRRGCAGRNLFLEFELMIKHSRNDMRLADCSQRKHVDGEGDCI
jgi:hypothetical protein